MEKKIMFDDVMKKYHSYKNEELRKKYISGLVTHTYAPIGMKYAVLNSMVEKSTITEENGVKYLNMLLSKVNFTIAILILYTDIEFPLDESGKVKTFDSYDALIQTDIIDIIQEAIGDREFNELLSVNQTVLDTFHERNSTVKAYIGDIMMNSATIFGTLSNYGADKVAEIMKSMEDENKVIELQNKISEFVNKLTDK